MTLRIINIAIFTVALVLLRQVFKRAGISKRMNNALLLVIVLTPVTSFLAAHVNYDNLLFLVSVMAILQTQKVLEKVSNKQIDILAITKLIIICLLGSLVKYAFLPVFFAVATFVTYKVVRLFLNSKDKTKFVRSQYKDLSKLPNSARVIWIVLLVLSSILFIERYGYNLAKYKAPAPECNQVVSIESCKSFGPWKRNYDLGQDRLLNKKPLPLNPAEYTYRWIKTIFAQLFFTLNSNTPGEVKIGYPQKLTQVLSAISIFFGLLLFVIYQKILRQKYNVDFLIFVTFVYGAILFLQNFSEYLHLGTPVAIQGRYLLPVLPFIYCLVALGYSQFLRSSKLAKSMLITVVVGFMITQGGGVGIYILRSDQTWYWSGDNRFMTRANNNVRKVLKSLAIGD